MQFAMKITGVGEEQGSADWRVQDTCRCRGSQTPRVVWAGRDPEELPVPTPQPCQDAAGNQYCRQPCFSLPPAQCHCWSSEGASLCCVQREGRNSRRGKVPFEAHGTKSFPVTMATAQWVPSLRTKLLQPCLKNKKSLKEGERGRWGWGCGGERLKQN